MEDVQKTDAIEIDKLEEVTGGDDLRGDRVPKYAKIIFWYQNPVSGGIKR